MDFFVDLWDLISSLLENVSSFFGSIVDFIEMLYGYAYVFFNEGHVIIGVLIILLIIKIVSGIRSII